MQMKKLVCLLAACTPMLGGQAAGSHLDGTWTTTMACDASVHMPAYQWTFPSTIANGSFHGQHGVEGGPGYLIVDGPIKSDGSAKLHAKGTVQPGKAGIVTELKGNKYDYNIEAKFTDTTGTGTRDKGAGILGRPCDFTFIKKLDSAPAAAPPAQ